MMSAAIGRDNPRRRLDRIAPPAQGQGMNFDVAIVGAGMAGASLAAQLAPQMRVLLLEAEETPGYHATGRSAAFWSETYGGPLVQPLTSASGPFLAAPPPDFSDHGFLKTRGALMIGQDSKAGQAKAFLDQFAHSGVALARWDAPLLAQHVPGLLPHWTEGVWEASTADIDVAGLHMAYLRAARRAGASLVTRHPVSQIRRTGLGWGISAGGAQFSAAKLVNAAGAWASQIADMAGAMPIQIQPMRRTMVQLRLAQPMSPDLPLIVDLAGHFYFKAEGADRLWLSPHDEIPSLPCDAAADAADVALALDRFAQVVPWPVAAVERRWAGLRSFTPDRAPVFGADPDCPEFYWCAGQGGAGIQTAPAIAALLAAEILGVAPPAPYTHIAPAAYAPARFAALLTNGGNG